MTAVDELLKLLKEQGLEHYRHEAHAEDCIAFFDGNIWHDCWESVDGGINVTFSMTPEQAIAATVGRGTCHLEEMDTDGDTASEWMMTREYVFDAVYRCSCGYRFGHAAYNRPRFCPNCGAEVVDE